MKPFKVWLLLALVFVAGLASGVVSTRAVTRRVVRAVLTHPGLIQEKIERDLDRKLNLNPHQQVEVHRVLTQSRGRLLELRRDFQPRLHVILSEARQEISASLTPEQQQKFQKYLDDHPLPKVSE